MLDEKAIKLLFFAIVEPTNQFWISEINSHGVVKVYERLTQKNYYEKISGYLKIREQLASLQISKLQADLLAANSSFITSEDHDWPSQLNDLAAPPVGLVIRGNRKVLQNLNNSISIVGSRKPTNYGLQVARKLATDSVAAQLVVVSGGAYGIDTQAHSATLEAKGQTISVLAGGFNKLYPVENKKLFDQINQQGLLISEAMPDTPTAPALFLIRNRLIAALSSATVVVEAEYVSGSIRTARDAAEIFRPVFAIPGQIDSPLSAGCHRLIADRVADIATTLAEILQVIRPLQSQ